MKIKHLLFLLYGTIGFLYALYGTFFGKYEYKGFFYNLGRGIIWPATMFPEVGKAIGGLIIIAFVLWITLAKK